MISYTHIFNWSISQSSSFSFSFFVSEVMKIIRPIEAARVGSAALACTGMQ